jgi:hypothetical protein
MPPAATVTLLRPRRPRWRSGLVGFIAILILSGRGSRRIAFPFLYACAGIGFEHLLVLLRTLGAG